MAGSDLPAVIINVQRGGPGLGGIQPSQADYWQATKALGHGDFQILVFAPSTVQEMVNLVSDAFDKADQYRMPAMILADGMLGQMMEPVELPEKSAQAAADKPWAACGHGGKRKHNIVNSLYLTPNALEDLVRERYARYETIKANEQRAEEYRTEDADLIVVAYGASSRVARSAVNKAREEGPQGWPRPPDHALAVPGGRGAARGKAGEAASRRGDEHGPDGRRRPSRRELRRAGPFLRPHGRHHPHAEGSARRNQETPEIRRKDWNKMAVVFKKPSTLTDAPLHYCPGCTHGIIHRLVAEAIEELGVEGRTVGVASVGCSVMCYDYFTCDMVQAPHGRAQAVATGLKRAKPENVIFTYQGDGDLAAIGTAETVHAATRGENITVIFVNNAIYGMTGGQMALTSLPNQVTQTTPYGRDVNTAGYPVRVCEMLSTLDGVALAQRVTVDSVKNVNIAKKAIKKAFQNQLEGKGYSIVEVLSTCPTNWGMSPVDALGWLRENMLPYYPLGVFKDGTKGDRLK